MFLKNVSKSAAVFGFHLRTQVASGLALAAVVSFAGVSQAAVIVATVVENVSTHQWNGPTKTMATADLTSLGNADWAIFGWDGTNSVHLNSKLNATRIGLASVAFNGGDTRFSGRGTVVPSWTYSDGTGPASATNQNLGGIGAMHGDQNTNRAISFNVDVTGLSQGTLSLWYATSQGNDNLTAALGSATATDNISEGFDVVRYKRVDFGFTDNTDNTLSVLIDRTANYSWTNSTTLYAAALYSAVVVPEPASLTLVGLGGMLLLARRRQA